MTKYVEYYDFQEDDSYIATLKEYKKHNMSESQKLLTQRLVILAKRDGLATQIHERINALRSHHQGLQQLTLTDELNEVAEEAWKARAAIPDGFVAIPGCQFESSGTTYGCLVYYSPRTDKDHSNYLPRAVETFWTNAGRPLDLAPEAGSGESSKAKQKLRYFPSAAAGETYTKPGNAVFEENRAKFMRQLLSPNCSNLGLYMDLVQADDVSQRNLFCLTAIFDATVEDED